MGSAVDKAGFGEEDDEQFNSAQEVVQEYDEPNWIINVNVLPQHSNAALMAANVGTAPLPAAAGIAHLTASTTQ